MEPDATEPELFAAAAASGGASPPVPSRGPLAARMRPRTLDEFVGQAGVVGVGRFAAAPVETDRLTSVMLWGPPGSGKTSLAAIIARATRADYLELSAVSSGVADVRKAIAAGEAGQREGRRTILFVDEIHRFNKSQQDALLKAVESGWVVLIGATTENPSFEVNAPLLSRSKVLVRLKPLTVEEITELLQKRAGRRAERGLGAAAGGPRRSRGVDLHGGAGWRRRAGGPEHPGDRRPR